MRKYKDSDLLLTDTGQYIPGWLWKQYVKADDPFIYNNVIIEVFIPYGLIDRS